MDQSTFGESRPGREDDPVRYRVNAVSKRFWNKFKDYIDKPANEQNCLIESAP